MRRTTEYCGQLAEALARPGTLPQDERMVRVEELPGSMVFVTDRRRLKLVKEGLERGDDPAARRLACERALRRNCQLSGRLYLGIAPLVGTVGQPVQLGDATELRGGARTFDWVIECRRSNREQALSCWVQRGVAPNGFESNLAYELAAFHSRARTGPRINQRGLSDSLRESVEELVEGLDERLDPEAHARCAPLLAFIGRGATRALDQRRSLFERRLADWRIRDTHGGLDCDTIEIGNDGEVRIWDCGDFAWETRCGDVLRDLSRLTVDLDDRGAPAWAATITKLYADQAGDAELPKLAPFYRTLAALELATGCFDGPQDPDPERAERLVQLAVGYQLEGCRVSYQPDPGLRQGRGAGVERAEHLASRLLVTPRPAGPGQDLPVIEVQAGGAGRAVRVEVPLGLSETDSEGGEQGDRGAERSAWCSQALVAVVERLAAETD